jgi:hypothetical protein
MPKHIRHKVDEDGWTEWIRPWGPSGTQKGYRMSCCDCGLSHEMEFDIDENNLVIMRARRHEKSTGQIRRHMKKESDAA